MIAEAPQPGCAPHALPALRRAMAVARSHVHVCSRAEITGVAFFDFKHGPDRGRPERDRTTPDPRFPLPPKVSEANENVRPNTCAECDRLWLDPSERWQAHLTVDDQLAYYSRLAGSASSARLRRRTDFKVSRQR
jgi:hypothetical protein